MFDFLKKVFPKKKEEEHSPEKVLILLRSLLNISLNKEALISSFPESRKEECKHHLKEGLKALARYGTRMKREQAKVNKVKIVNLFKLIITYGDDLTTNKVSLQKRK